MGDLPRAVLRSRLRRSVAVITRTLEVGRDQPELYRTVRAVMLGSAVFSLGVGLTDFGPKASLSALVRLLLAPIAAGTVVWLRHTDPDTAA